jgi:hypothetical protein
MSTFYKNFSIVPVLCLLDVPKDKELIITVLLERTKKSLKWDYAPEGRLSDEVLEASGDDVARYACKRKSRAFPGMCKLKSTKVTLAGLEAVPRLPKEQPQEPKAANRPQQSGFSQRLYVIVVDVVHD